MTKTSTTTSRNGATALPGRRLLLRGALVAGAAAMVGVPLSGCSPSSPPQATSRPEDRATAPSKPVLLAYFSRPGENYHYGGRRNLDVGNTEILARMISERIRCEVHRIQPADPYPADYEQTVERNVREQDTGARPPIVNPLTTIDRYDTVLLASPIRNVRAPMIMTTFTEASTSPPRGSTRSRPMP